MKSILPLKKIYYNDHVSKLVLDGLTDEEVTYAKRRCQTVAEVRAFIDTVIDSAYNKLSIFDFNGETKSKQKALEPKEAMRANNLVCKYSLDIFSGLSHPV